MELFSWLNRSANTVDSISMQTAKSSSANMANALKIVTSHKRFEFKVYELALLRVIRSHELELDVQKNEIQVLDVNKAPLSGIYVRIINPLCNKFVLGFHSCPVFQSTHRKDCIEITTSIMIRSHNV